MKRILFAIAAIAVLSVPFMASALTIDPSLGATLDLGTADLYTTVLNIIRWFLGFLGLIAVVFVLYGGFTWLTAAGNEERISKAKKIISAAVVGLIIVLLAWAIVSFVVNQSETIIN